MERRAAETRVAAPPVVEATTEEVATATAPVRGTARSVAGASARTRGAAPTRARASARPMALTREQEYRFIRNDLNRLLITAGSLLLLMIVLLFLIEG